MKTTFLSILTKTDPEPHPDHFKNPIIFDPYGFSSLHGLQPILKSSGEIYYYSKAKGHDSSMWKEYQEWYSTIKKETENQWLDSIDYNYISIDLKEKGILVIDNESQLLDFFVKYAIIVQRSVDSDGCTSNDADKLRYKYYKENQVLLDYYYGHFSSDDKLFITNPKIDEKINKIKEHRSMKSKSFVKVINGEVVEDRRKTRFTFFIDLIRTIEYNIPRIGDPSTIYVKTYLSNFDYNKLYKDGYNGIYYSDKLIKINPDLHLITEDVSSWKRKYIVPINIGEFPDVVRDISRKDKIAIKEELEGYIHWLGSDTLIVWGNIFFI
jgi:hypothetical protein